MSPERMRAKKMTEMNNHMELKNIGYMDRKQKKRTENCLKESTTGDKAGIMFSQGLTVLEHFSYV